MAEQRESKLVELFALWKNTSQSGETYLSGNLGNSKVLVLKNNRKEEGDNQPDYRVFVAPKERDSNGGGSKGNEDI
jgi:uncharacterized protein (DUF736 family)